MEWYVIPIFLGIFIFLGYVWTALSNFAREMHDWHFEEFSQLNFPEFRSSWDLLLEGGNELDESERKGLKAMLDYILKRRYRELRDRRLLNKGNWIRFWIYVAVGLCATPLLLVFTLFGEWNS